MGFSMSLFLSWVIGYAGNKGADWLLDALRKEPLFIELHKEVEKWMETLPDDAQLLASEAMFPDHAPNDNERHHLTLVKEKLLNKEVPNASEWEEALLEQARYVKSMRESPQDFFKLEENQLKNHLSRLAKGLEVVCATHKGLFEHNTYQMLRQLLQQKQHTDAPKAAGILIEAKDGTVWPGSDKYEKNGVFKAETCFYISVGSEPVIIMATLGHYLVNGCYSLTRGEGSLYTVTNKGVQQIKLDFSGDVLDDLQLPANSRTVLKFYRDFRPPLMSQEPADCLNGDLSLNIQWRPLSQLERQEYNVCFSYENNHGNRTMAMISSPRTPPRFSDEEITELFENKQISEYEHEQVMKLPHQSRYVLATCQDTDGTVSWYPDFLRELLISIYQRK